MKTHEPSRILNETKIGILGLSVQDFILLIGLYGIFQLIFTWIIGPSIGPMILLSIFSAGLIFIRNKFRKHILRDLFMSLKIRILYLGQWHDKTR